MFLTKWLSQAGRATPNYDYNTLTDIVEALQPVSTEDWAKVANRYRIMKGEVNERDALCIKRAFIDRL